MDKYQFARRAILKNYNEWCQQGVETLQYKEFTTLLISTHVDELHTFMRRYAWAMAGRKMHPKHSHITTIIFSIHLKK